jgi:hypothetical protein
MHSRRGNADEFCSAHGRIQKITSPQRRSMYATAPRLQGGPAQQRKYPPDCTGYRQCARIHTLFLPDLLNLQPVNPSVAPNELAPRLVDLQNTPAEPAVQAEFACD